MADVRTRSKLKQNRQTTHSPGSCRAFRKT
jgi:hypothetical protein